jgi:hypothetical protein
MCERVYIKSTLSDLLRNFSNGMNKFSALFDLKGRIYLFSAAQ